jgi:hypothetical protein
MKQPQAPPKPRLEQPCQSHVNPWNVSSREAELVTKKGNISVIWPQLFLPALNLALFPVEASLCALPSKLLIPTEFINQTSDTQNRKDVDVVDRYSKYALSYAGTRVAIISTATMRCPLDQGLLDMDKG